MTLPADFSLLYEWCAASVPPPFHYEYKIMITANNCGIITFIPDYPSNDTPIWQKEFTISPPDLEHLFQLMQAGKVFRDRWGKPRRHQVGGSQSWLIVEADSRQYRVPVTLTRKDAVEMASLYDVICSLIPNEIWKSLQAKRQRYEDNTLALRSSR